MPDPWFFEVGWIGEVADLDPFAEFLAGLPGRTFVYGAGHLDDGTPEGAPARAERYRVERDEARAALDALDGKFVVDDSWDGFVGHIRRVLDTHYPEDFMRGACANDPGGKFTLALYAALRDLDGEEQITHGRHCTCSPCAREDWTNPALAACGMHGASCPAEYAPLGAAGSWVARERVAPSTATRVADEAQQEKPDG